MPISASMEVHPSTLREAADALVAIARTVRDAEWRLAGSIAFAGSATGDPGVADVWGSAWGSWSRALLDLTAAIDGVADSLHAALATYEAADVFPGRS